MDLGVSGLASGFDWRSLVDQLADVERTPQTRLRSEQQALNSRNTAFGALKTELGNLRSILEKLKTGNFFLTRSASSSAEGVAKATAGATATPGQYALKVTQLASAAVWKGASNVGAGLSTTSNVSGVVLGSAAFPTAITQGTFSVNGKQVQVALTDSLQDVFDKISTATGGTVTGSYDPVADKISLAGASPIMLGSATDTSNFLSAARLRNGATLGNTVTSDTALGGVKTNGTLAGANFATPITDGGAGAGEFKVNGVSITYNASTDSIANVLERINNSAAGVIASYDSINDRFQLVNKVTGDIGVGIADVTGNFAAVTGLSTGSLQRGTDLVYTVNSGGELRSPTNTITEASSGIPGLTINVLGEGETNIGVSSDVELIKKGIKDFVEAYNKVQSLIDTQTASSTDAKGKVTAGVLADDSEADDIASSLRRLAYGQMDGLVGGLKSLDSLGIQTSGDNNLLTIGDEEKFEQALTQNLAGVQALFTDPEKGLAIKLDEYLEKTIGDDGTLVNKQGNLTKESGAIDTQIADLERIVLANREAMIQSFLAMEQAQAKVNQQLSFLQQRFSSNSA